MKKARIAPSIAMIVLTIGIAAGLVATRHFLGKDEYHLFPITILTVFIISLLIRKQAWAKPYFTSRYNILSAKYRYKEEFDFPKDLLFEKFMEVLKEAGFAIGVSNKNTGDILALSKTSLFSWGENIYIHFEELKDKTTVDFCSACFFQMYSWGKNEDNYEKIIKQFEESLII